VRLGEDWCVGGCRVWTGCSIIYHGNAIITIRSTIDGRK
jgi:hypothetical protein